MKKLLTLALLTLLCPSMALAAFERTGGIGKAREHITDEELASRARAAADAQEFWLLRQPCTEKAPEKILKGSYYKKIVTEAEKFGINLFWPAAVFYIESCGNPNAKSPTGPAGLGQHSKASAKEQGLVVEDIKRKIGTHLESIYKWRGKGKQRKRVEVGQKKITDYQITHIDERLIPERAIEATVARLAQRTRWFGDIKWALVDYHMGTGNLMTALSLYLGHKVTTETAKTEIEKGKLTWERVFFGNTPYYRAGLYNFLLKLKEKNDFSPTYLFRILKASELLQLYQNNSFAYKIRWDANQNRFKPNVVTPNLMWSFFTPEDVEKLKFETLEQIQAAQGKDLVLLPQPWSQYGLRVRLTGDSKIAEKDPRHQPDYIAARPGTVGCLLYLADELKLLEEKKFAPLEVNSLVRSEQTQSALKTTNSNAKTLLPAHEMAWAFDVPKLKMKGWQKKDLLFILGDLELQGMLAFIPEGAQDTTHVVPHPNYQQYFEKYYRDTVPKDQQIRTVRSGR